MRHLRINRLSLEEIEQAQSNSPESTAEDDLSSTAETESTAEDQGTVDAMESRYLVLEDMIQSWKQSGKLTPLILRQAHEALPELGIINGKRTHEERYQLAMEGILTQFKIAYDKLTDEQRDEHQKEYAEIVDTLIGNRYGKK